MRGVFFLLLIGLFLTLPQETAFGFWIWSPKRGTFTQPKDIAQKTPTDQLAWAVSFYEAGAYDRALKEMKKLVRSYPESAEAAEAQFYVGRCYEALGAYDDAFKAYETLLEKYPNSERIQEVIAYEYRIANLYYSGKKRKIMGLEILPSYRRAVEIYERVVAHAPYGAYAELAQYKIGACYRKMGDHRKSREAFEKLIESYPNSELVDDARYQIALATYRMSRGASYDPETTDKALEKFEAFVAEHPESELAGDSREVIRELRERKAQKAFEIAEFYARQEATEAARVYYNKAIEEEPGSAWAAQALEALTLLEKKEKK